MKTLYAKAFRSARKDRMRVVFLEPDLAYVARRKRGHGQYLVRFFPTQRIDGSIQLKMNCNTITGGPCDGLKWKDCCSHIAKVILRSEAKPNRKEKQEAA